MLLSAQSQWGIGHQHSIKEAGLVVEWGKGAHEVSRAGVTLDLGGILTGETGKPGYRVSYQRCFFSPVSHWNDGSEVSIFYGPGIGGGTVRDHNGERGSIAFLSGTVGLHFLFPDSPITVSACICAELGLHRERVSGGHSILRFYQNGLRRVWMPELQFIYHFR